MFTHTENHRQQFADTYAGKIRRMKGCAMTNAQWAAANAKGLAK